MSRVLDQPAFVEWLVLAWSLSGASHYLGAFTIMYRISDPALGGS